MGIRRRHTGIIVYAGYFCQGFFKGHSKRNFYRVQVQIFRDKSELTNQTVGRTVNVGANANAAEGVGLFDDFKQAELGGTDQQAGIFSQYLVVFVGNHLIDFQDDRHARGVVYCRGQIQDGEKWIEQAIQYRDRYERRGDEWLFVRRSHLLWYGVETAERPLDQPPADWPERHVGRGTLPEQSESWQAFWRARRERGG